MNAKYAVALLLALQVSMSLCDSPTPSTDLTEKYNAYKATFLSRLKNLYQKTQANVNPLLEQFPAGEGQTAKDKIETLQENPEFQKGFKIGYAVGQEILSMVEESRAAALGLYEKLARPHIGVHLDATIHKIKPILDKILPAEGAHD